MKRKREIAIVIAFGLLVWYGPRVYQRWYWNTFEAGFKRGTMWEARYEQCFPGHSLSIEAQDYLAHFVDDPFQHSCTVIQVTAESAEAKRGPHAER